MSLTGEVNIEEMRVLTSQKKYFRIQESILNGILKYTYNIDKNKENKVSVQLNED